MEHLHVWYLLVGALLLILGLIYQTFRSLPISTSLIYLGTGYALGGPLGLARLHAAEHWAMLEILTEIGVLLSLFTAGLKLHLPLGGHRWRIPVALATTSMLLYGAAATWIGTQLLHLPLGAAVLLAAILAPTDPVLASEVQVRKPGDQHPVRFNLTAEAGINDGAAFPFVFLGLGLLGLHDLGDNALRWIGADLLWATAAGLAVGAASGTAAGHLVVWLRQRFSESVNAEELVGLGLMAFSYGLALWLHAYGFLAVFAAGLALRRLERRAPEHGHEEAIARELLHFHESLELLAEAGLVLLLGILLASTSVPWHLWWLPALLFAVVRPLAVALSLLTEPAPLAAKAQIAWFGVRGIGSLYYCAFACNHGLAPQLGQQLFSLTLLVVTASIVVHGVSAGPITLAKRESPGRSPEVVDG